MKRIILGLLIAGLLAANIAISQQGLRVYIDGQHVGTVDDNGVYYDFELNTITLQTREGLVGCTLDRIFWDRYED